MQKQIFEKLPIIIDFLSEYQFLIVLIFTIGGLIFTFLRHAKTEESKNRSLLTWGIIGALLSFAIGTINQSQNQAWQNKVTSTMTGDSIPRLLINLQKCFYDENNSQKGYLIEFSIENKGKYGLKDISFTINDRYSWFFREKYELLNYGNFSFQRQTKSKKYIDSIYGDYNYNFNYNIKRLSPKSTQLVYHTGHPNKYIGIYEFETEIYFSYFITLTWSDGSLDFTLNFVINNGKLKLENIEQINNDDENDENIHLTFESSKEPPLKMFELMVADENLGDTD